MNAVLEEILKTRLVKSPEGEVRELAGEISQEEGLLLRQAIHECQAAKTLEVGLWYGVSALFICEAIAGKPGAHHIVMDPHQFRDSEGIGLNNIKLAGYEEIVDFYDQSSHIVLPELVAKEVKIDFAFIDASHLFDYTLLEFFYIDRLLKVGGIMAFDDASMPAVWKVCRFISTNRRYKVYDCGQQQVTLKQRCKYALIKAACKVCPPLRRLIKTELQEPDFERGLVPGARYMAFIKESDDSEEIRPYHFYRDF